MQSVFSLPYSLHINSIRSMAATLHDDYPAPLEADKITVDVFVWYVMCCKLSYAEKVLQHWPHLDFSSMRDFTAARQCKEPMLSDILNAGLRKACFALVVHFVYSPTR
uniref:Uncharacterized protein n=1 Tax=Rhipicephalus zambeziensis TaxID=60191 RepID=A0A224Y577_9ACAR